MANPINTLDDLIEIKKWLFEALENATVTEEMSAYSPMVYFHIPIDLSGKHYPKEILEIAKSRVYERNENDS